MSNSAKFINFFKKSTVGLVFSVAGIGVSAPVQAVNIAQDGLGEALVFPYYTTRAGWITLFNVTNTSNETVLIKVRWREALNSRNVRDFIVVLSPFDVWTAVTRQGDDAPEVITADHSCTYPKLAAYDQGLTGKKFTNRSYSQDTSGAELIDNRDGASTALDRAEEGYFEVFNLGSINNNSQKLSGDAATLVNSAKHKKDASNQAVGANCALVRSVFENRSALQINALLSEPKNVLKGRALLVAGEKGIAAAYDPLVLADFVSHSIYAKSSEPLPNLSSADPIALVVNDGQSVNAIGFSPTSSKVVKINTKSSPTSGVDAVSALISRSNVINDYNIKGDSKTSWVLTFPTKSFYVDRALYSSNNQSPIGLGEEAPLSPFKGLAPVFNETSCFNFRLSLGGRDRYNAIADRFSPSIPTDKGGMCYETNILSFSAAVEESNLLGSTRINRDVIGADNKGVLPAANGWAIIGFGGNPENKGQTVNSGEKIMRSLPVIGMRIETRNRGNAAINYGLINDHAYIGNRIQPQLGLDSKVVTTLLKQ